MGVFLAKMLKGNTILAAVGTWISNPFTYVPLYYFNYRLGSLILNKDNSIVNNKNKLYYRTSALDDLAASCSVSFAGV